MTESLVKPKRPKGPGWEFATWWKMPPEMAAMGYPVEPWYHAEHMIFVLSAVEVATTPKGEEDLGPEYHLSMSRAFRSGPERLSRDAARWVLKQFGMEDATEDNHVPHGKVRNWWLPVAEKFAGYECPCVDSEPAIKEDKGDFIWRGAPK